MIYCPISKRFSSWKTKKFEQPSAHKVQFTIQSWYDFNLFYRFPRYDFHPIVNQSGNDNLICFCVHDTIFVQRKNWMEI